MDFSPRCRPLLIGSLPLTDYQSALEMIFRYTPEIPLWPQLPRLPKEGMIRQFLDGFPGLKEEGKRLWVDTEARDFPEQMAAFYEECGQTEAVDNPCCGRFAMNREAAGGFYAFCQALTLRGETKLWTVKGQITGPITTGIGVRDSHGAAIVHDDNLRDTLTRLIAMRAACQARVLGGLVDTGVPPVIFIDEPAMVGFGSSGFSGISREMVSEAVGQVIAGIHRGGAVAGVHICANGDWQPVLASETDIVSFDAYSYFDNLILYRQPLLDFLGRGGVLAWGIVPTGDVAALERATADSLYALWRGQFAKLLALGIPEEQARARLFITPSCGTGSLTVAQAEKVLRLTAELSRCLRREFYGSSAAS
jgi:hypothetical protein